MSVSMRSIPLQQLLPVICMPLGHSHRSARIEADIAGSTSAAMSRQLVLLRYVDHTCMKRCLRDREVNMCAWVAADFSAPHHTLLTHQHPFVLPYTWPINPTPLLALTVISPHATTSANFARHLRLLAYRLLALNVICIVGTTSGHMPA